MTTIVATRKAIAGDKQLTRGVSKSFVDTKIMEVRGNQAWKYFNAPVALVGFSGSPAEWADYKYYIKADSRKPRFRDLSVLVLTKNGIAIGDNGSSLVWLEDEVAAIGTGKEYAIGAVLGGASLETAIEVASNKDIYTGGGCTVYTL